MKKLLLLVLLVSAGFTETPELDCGSFSELAKVVMTSRQTGANPVEIVEKFDRPIVTFLVKHAWAVPEYRTEAHKLRAIREFRDSMYMKCLRLE